MTSFPGSAEPSSIPGLELAQHHQQQQSTSSFANFLYICTGLSYLFLTRVSSGVLAASAFAQYAPFIQHNLHMFPILHSNMRCLVPSVGCSSSVSTSIILAPCSA